MADTVAAPRRHRWPRVLGLIVLFLIVVLVCLYFVVTSTAFFKGVILPRVSRTLNANVTVANASIHPFTGVELHGLKVQTTGPTPLLTAENVRVGYGLADILRGNYNFREIVILSPVVDVVTNPDGTSNLDPLTKKKPQPSPQNQPGKAQPSQPARVQHVDINHLVLSNGTIRVVKNYIGGYRDMTLMTNANLTLTNLANGQNGGLKLAADVAIDNHPPTPGTNATLQGVVAGNFTFTMSQDLKPVTVAGNAHFDAQNAGGALSDVSGLRTLLNCDVTPTDIKQVALRFEKNGGNLGGINLSGPFDMAKTEGHLHLEVTPIGKQVLDLLGANSGIDFGQTTLSSTNELDFTHGGNQVAVSGRFNANKLTLTRQNQTTPAMDAHSDYQLTVDRANNTALLQKFNLNGTQNQQPLLHGELTSPMTISFSTNAGSSGAVGESSLKLVVTNFNLADWKAIVGTNASSGMLNSGMTILSQQGGKQLTIDFNSRLADLTAKVGTNQLQQASMNLQGHLISQQASGSLTGNVTLSDFNGRYETYQFQNYGTKVNLNIVSQKPQLEIKDVSGTVYEGNNPGGQFQLTGNYNQDNKSGQLALKLAGLNQNGLRPFLGAFIGEKKLVSVSLNGTTTANYTSGGESSVKSDLQVTNLVVTDNKGQRPAEPLEARLQLDASMKNQVAQLRQLLLSLSPTTNAPNNQVSVTGQLDMSQTNAIAGSLKLASDTLDVSRFYDLYSTKSPSPKHKAAAPSPAPPAPTPAANTEPPPKHLPIKNFTLDANISRFYMDEIVINNLQTSGRIEGSHITLQPLQGNLNGGPINGSVDLDLGVPGYQYNINFSGQQIPLAPLADTLSPEYRGRAKGQASANLQIKGIGTTGASMQKNLSGQASLSLTNANIQITGHKVKAILTPIATALRVPELMQSPITWVVADLTIGNGQINVTQFKAEGPALNASSQGTVSIADVLTNSPINNLPVNLAISSSLASKARLTPSNANTNAAYVNLGKVATVGGTVGNPKTKIDYAAIGLITTRAVGGVLGGKTGNIMQGVGGALGGILGGQGQQGGNQQQQPQQPPSNQPGTNQPPPKSGNPFDLLHKILPK